MNILVTGGAGFIGSNFIRHMLDKYKDYEITNYDKLTYAGNLHNLDGIDGQNNNYHFTISTRSTLILILSILFISMFIIYPSFLINIGFEISNNFLN